MRSIVVGCGRVGASLAARLAREGHDVAILDMSTEAFRRLDPEFPGQALRGDGTDESVLRRAGAEGADWFFALTNGDNRNILAAQLAAETFGIPRVLAKINDPVRAETYAAALGIDTIDRTTWMVDAISRYMGKPGEPGAADVSVAPDRHAHAGPERATPGEAAPVRGAGLAEASAVPTPAAASDTGGG